MSWFLVILFLIVTFGTFSEANNHHHHKKPTSAVVVGTVYCDTCFQQDFSMGNHIISGASVEVECKDEHEISKPRFKKQVKTNEHGEFRIQLPFSISKHVKRIKGCVVKLVSSNEPYCSIASTATSSSINLKSRKQGLHIFSAGFFSFKPLKQPNLCNQKPSIQNTKKLVDSLKKKSLPPKIDPSFPPPLQDPNTHNGGILPPILPPIPLLPEIVTPILPPILSPLVPSGTTNDESKSKSTKASKNVVESLDEKVTNVDSFNIPPNPFFPPPLVPNNPLQPSPLVPNPLQPPSTPLVPPNPFQPPTTPTIPNPFQPPPSRSSPPLFPFPSVPGLSPSTPPSLGFPFPPLFPSPGTPPASSKNGSP
ncbi:unnamed protein product [Trifolium pratense]|uniref:Uncharacterized protein n=1 Tax=Trifolium pratense TaxID=57577 RepID=A0ACB0LKJ5_TRIPR|nr:unnamed protein product [Trifolium pratense]